VYIEEVLKILNDAVRETRAVEEQSDYIAVLLKKARVIDNLYTGKGSSEKTPVEGKPKSKPKTSPKKKGGKRGKQR
jgi:hypothetical protein